MSDWLDERLRLPCGICGKRRNEHIGTVHGCPQGYGTSWNPEGKRDYRVWPEPAMSQQPIPSPDPYAELRALAKSMDDLVGRAAALHNLNEYSYLRGKRDGIEAAIKELERLAGGTP